MQEVETAVLGNADAKAAGVVGELVPSPPKLRRAGVPLKTICDYFTLVDQGGQTAELRRAMLLEQRNAMVKQIADMQKNVCALDNILDSAFPPLLYENEKQAAGL